jgi:hypothetical protein
MTADMEILRGLENLGAPWDCMGRFPVTKKQPGIIETIGANMILDMFLEIYHGSIRYRPDTGMGALVYSSLPC